MSWSVTIGRIGGTAVRVHFTLLLFLVWIGVSAWQRQGVVAAANSLAFIVLLFACIVAHEFGHIIAARRYGIDTPDVTLLPIGGVASLKRLPSEPRQELVVALAGPAVNLVIGLVLLVAVGSFDPERAARIDDPTVSLPLRLAVANLFLAIFNLIPAFPMDGGRVLHALLAVWLGGARATEVAAKIGEGLAVVFAFLGLMGNPMLLFIAIFIFIAAAGEARMSALQQALKGLTVEDVMETRIATLPAEATLAEAVQTLMSTAQHDFPVVDAFGKPMGVLPRMDILAALASRDGAEPAAAIMHSPVETVRPRMKMEDALERLGSTGAMSLFVTDDSGALVGILPRQALADVMLIRAARPEWRFTRGA